RRYKKWRTYIGFRAILPHSPWFSSFLPTTPPIFDAFVAFCGRNEGKMRKPTLKNIGFLVQMLIRL
ncbi:hypothetical protein, partial [Acetobacter orientalis]|uniref:hypothetical protein n=1 Tax=Acetobacter orientalis TaxID=146474 RepID=UPI0039EC32D2